MKLNSSLPFLLVLLLINVQNGIAQKKNSSTNVQETSTAQNKNTHLFPNFEKVYKRYVDALDRSYTYTVEEEYTAMDVGRKIT